MTLLQLQDLTYRYKNTAEAVLYQINYNFEPGKFYSIIGESGAGKSTLLSLLAGLDSPVEGSILFEGQDIRDKGYSYHRMHHISLVFQNYNLIDYLSPLENIRLVIKRPTRRLFLNLVLTKVRSSGMFSSYQVDSNNGLPLLAVWYRKPQLS